MGEKKNDSSVTFSTVLLRHDKSAFWEFLKENDIKYQKTHFPFLTSHKNPQLKQVFDFGEYLGLSSRGEALAYLYNGLGKSLNYVGPVLDLDMPHGFNDHTDRHTLWVSQTGVELLQRAGVDFSGKGRFDAKTEVLMTLVAMMHDLGNFVGRKEHSTHSAWMLNRMFGNRKANKREWKAVEYAVLYHEEPVLLEKKVSLVQGLPLQWALVAADKMHVGRERIGGRSFASGIKMRAFDEDVHILINSMIVRSVWYMSREKTFVWRLEFSIDQLEKKFVSFTRGNERLWVPKWIQKRFLSQGVKYRDSFAKLFVKTYKNRMKVLATSVFLLFPYLERFEVRLGDVDTRGKVGSKEFCIWEMKRKEIMGQKPQVRAGVGNKWWKRK